jgi:hypothetical protein
MAKMETAPTTIYTASKIEFVKRAITNAMSHITPGYIKLVVMKYCGHATLTIDESIVYVLKHNLEKIQCCSWIGCEFKNGYMQGNVYRCEMHIDEEVVMMQINV